MLCDVRPSGQPWELAPQRQDSVNTISLQKVRSPKKMCLYGTLGREQEQQRTSAAPSQQKKSALERIVSNLLGVVGSLAKPAMQGQAAAAGFWAEKIRDTLTTMSHL